MAAVTDNKNIKRQATTYQQKYFTSTNKQCMVLTRPLESKTKPNITGTRVLSTDDNYNRKH